MGNPHHQHQGQHQHGSAGEPDWADMAEVLDLDAEVLHSYLAEVTTWVLSLAAGLPCRRIADLGAGTGTGAVALAQRASGANVIALDRSPDLLLRCMARARDYGVADRVRTVQADLDAPLPAIGAIDLAWASNSLHHMADPDRVLTEVFATLRPGGLLAVVEMDSLPRFLPDEADEADAGGAGLEARCHAVLAQAMADELPHLGSDWGVRLRQAGFAIEAERTFAIDLTPPLHPAAGRYAQANLRRLRSRLDGKVSAGDLIALDALIDSGGPGSVLQRDDLAIRASRTVLVARRPCPG